MPKLTDRTPRLNPLSNATISLLEQVDRVEVHPIPTCATAVVEGKVVLMLGAAYMAIPVVEDDESLLAQGDWIRENLLRHELGHLIANHHDRRQDRDQRLWNQVCDCAIHAKNNSIDLDALATALDSDLGLCRYEVFGLDEQPPESAYDALVEQQDDPQGNGPEGLPGGCGRPTQAEISESYEPSLAKDPVSQARNAARATELEKAIIDGWNEDAKEATEGTGLEPVDTSPPGPATAGTEAGAGRTQPDAKPVLPPWANALLEELEDARTVRTKRSRSWLREHRELPELLPGRALAYGPGCTLIVDASGSMNHSLLNTLLGALNLVPDFAASDVFVHDTNGHGPWPAYDIDAVRAGIELCGGGTYITRSWHQIAPKVNAHLPRVFFTDGCSGDGLPTELPGDIFVHTEYGYPTAVCDRARLERRLKGQEARVY